MSWTKQDAKKLADRILSFSKAPECEVALAETSLAHTRFAANEITTSGAARDLSVSITSRGEGKSGSVRVNDLDAEALRKAVALSEELMARRDARPRVRRGPRRRRRTRRSARSTTTRRSAGALEHRAGREGGAGRGARADADGRRASPRRSSRPRRSRTRRGTSASTSGPRRRTRRRCARRTAPAPGWAGFESPRFGDVKPADLAARAAKKAQACAAPKELPPGAYTVILEPRAVADLLGTFFSSLTRRTVDEGRSFLSKPGGGNRIGEKVFAPSVTLRSDPFDPRLSGRPWSGGGGPGGGGGGGGFLGFGGFGGGGAVGLPARKTTWIEKGVVKAVPVDRYWAAKNGLEALPFSGRHDPRGRLGHARRAHRGDRARPPRDALLLHPHREPADRRAHGPHARRPVARRERQGRRTRSSNFRFNDSPSTLLKNVEAMSASEPAGNMVAPAIRAQRLQVHVQERRGLGADGPGAIGVEDEIEAFLSVEVPLRLLARRPESGPRAAPVLLGMHGYGMDAESLLAVLVAVRRRGSSSCRSRDRIRRS